MGNKIQLKDRLIVALDSSDENEVLGIVHKLGASVGYFKVGLELFTAFGPPIIKKIKHTGSKIFFDGKFLDIPNTVSHAVSNMVRHKVDMINVYLSGGKNMLLEAKKLLLETAQIENISPPKLLGVTVLTSITSEVLKNDLKVQAHLEEYVLHLAEFALEANLDGIICSPNEAKIVKKAAVDNKNFLIVTPGVRPIWADTNDQKRVATPKEAIANGATHIVVGRPITQSKNPLDAVKKILDELEETIR